MGWTYPLIMLAAIGTACAIFLSLRQPLGLTTRQKLSIALGAFCGGMVGAKLPFVLADWPGFISGAAWFQDGKTIVSGLVGGYFGAQLAEWALCVRLSTCDLLAAPLAGGIAVGRLACFMAGCCHGTATMLPWGVDFGDHVRRHPTQLYESAFHLVACVVLYQMQRRQMFRGQLVRWYFVAYFLYRFATEFIRPEPRILWGMTGYQWSALVLIPFFALWCCAGCRRWPRRYRQRTEFPPLEGDPSAQRMHGTTSLCPECLKSVSGDIILRGEQVHLRRKCPEHGEMTALLSSDRRHYYLRDEVPHPPPSAEACCGGHGAGHCTCVGLLEITTACNLRCPVCYAGSGDGVHRPIKAIQADLDAFLARRGKLDVLQLSGGEPLLHPDLFPLIDYCHSRPITMVMINTNGLELLRREGLAAELARRLPRLELSLQMDGLDHQAHLGLRGDDLLDQKRRVLEIIAAHRLPTTLVATVARGINESQLGPLLQLGLGTRSIRGLTIQPATWCGRYDPARDPLNRVTLADVVRLLAEQSGGLLGEDDFHPLPCSHPNCCSFTVLARPENGRPEPLTRLVNYEDHLEQISDRLAFNLDDASSCGQPGRTPADFFRIVIKPFMDAYTYDKERADECCVHIITPGGKPVSFCQFNILTRGRRSSLPILECDHECRCS